MSTGVDNGQTPPSSSATSQPRAAHPQRPEQRPEQPEHPWEQPPERPPAGDRHGPVPPPPPYRPAAAQVPSPQGPFTQPPTAQAPEANWPAPAVPPPAGPPDAVPPPVPPPIPPWPRHEQPYDPGAHHAGHYAGHEPGHHPDHRADHHARPGRSPRAPGARSGAALCLVLGLGLIGTAVAGAAVDRGPRTPAPVADDSAAAFATARQVWRNTPVSTLFPPTVSDRNAGPGGADRAWTRIGVAAPAGCAGAFDPPLSKVLAPAGCVKLLRATYVDSTSTTVTTVGLLVTAAQAPAMRALNERWSAGELGDRTDLLPAAVAFPGTAAARFGGRQRGSWDVQISADLPFVVYAVSGFADGRGVPAPQPAAKATADGATTAPAQAGLGFDADDLASAVDDRLHAAVSAELHPKTNGPEKR